MDGAAPSSGVDAKLAALERNDGTQDKQIGELFHRVNVLERQQSAQGATQHGMQSDIVEAKTASQQANDKLDSLKTWMLGIAATTAVTAIMTLIALATKKL